VVHVVTLMVDARGLGGEGTWRWCVNLACRDQYHEIRRSSGRDYCWSDLEAPKSPECGASRRDRRALTRKRRNVQHASHDSCDCDSGAHLCLCLELGAAL
jgi:hypothetical protein